MKKILVTAAALILGFTGCASSAEQYKANMSATKKMGKVLTKTEVETLFTDKTVKIDANNGKKYTLKHSKDGNISGSFSGSWFVKDDGTKCINHPRGKSCVLVVKKASGEYISVKDGEQTSVFKF